MSDDKTKQRLEVDAELERKIRKDRKFSPEEALGRMAGPGAMKGVSPITGMQQAVVEIENWFRTHMPAGNGELEVVMLRQIKGSEMLLGHYQQPLEVLGAYCRQVFDSDYLLEELVCAADVEWGQVHGERPYFEKEGLRPDSEDPYTSASARKTLASIMERLTVGEV